MYALLSTIKAKPSRTVKQDQGIHSWQQRTNLYFWLCRREDTETDGERIWMDEGIQACSLFARSTEGLSALLTQFARRVGFRSSLLAQQVRNERSSFERKTNRGGEILTFRQASPQQFGELGMIGWEVVWFRPTDQIDFNRLSILVRSG